MKNYSQITFEFQDPPDSGENAGVGVRIKSLKKSAKDVTKESDNAGDTVQEELVFNDQPRNEVIAEAAEIETPETDHVSDVTELTENTANAGKPGKSTRGRKSLKTIDDGTDLINVPPDEQLFQKQYYAIGEVAEMFQVNQSLLRFWETEFDIIQPRKNRKGDRHFRPVDIKNLLLIHDLLRRRKLTIEGAKDFLKKNKRSPERFAMIQSLQKIKGFILEVKATL